MMRALIVLSVVGLAGAESPPMACGFDGADIGSELMDSAIFTWASVERCQKGSMKLECEIDIASAIDSVTGMIQVILKTVAKCGHMNTVNAGCGAASMGLTKSVAGIAASSGGIVQHCKAKPVAVNHTLGHLNLALCTVNVKSSLQYLMKAVKAIVQVSKDCKDGPDGKDCTENAIKLVEAFAGLGEFLAAAAGHCRPQQTGVEGCASAVSGLVKTLIEVGDAGKDMSVQCSLPNHGEGPNHVIEAVEVPNPANEPRLYQQQKSVDSGMAGISSNGILAAFLPITAVVSFVGGRFYANRHSGQAREVMDDDDLE